MVTNQEVFFLLSKTSSTKPPSRNRKRARANNPTETSPELPSSTPSTDVDAIPTIAISDDIPPLLRQQITHLTSWIDSTFTSLRQQLLDSQLALNEAQNQALSLSNQLIVSKRVILELQKGASSSLSSISTSSSPLSVSPPLASKSDLPASTATVDSVVTFAAVAAKPPACPSPPRNKLTSRKLTSVARSFSPPCSNQGFKYLYLYSRYKAPPREMR
ncbi:hypothetical protein A0J61_11691, partial [Choanephora cucurbitarum]